MSSDWRACRLADVINIKHGFAFKGEHFVESQTPYQLTTPGNFAVGGGFQPGKGKYYSGPVPDDYILNPGDIVVTMTDLSKAADTLGFAAFIPNKVGTTWLHNQRVGLVQIKSEAPILPGYLQYLMRTSEYRHWVVSTATGSTVKHTSPGRICEFEFALPSLREQEEIAKVLSTFDSRIALLRETNATIEAMAQALFKSWFVDFDPVHAKQKGAAPDGMSEAAAALFPDSFVKSELGLVPSTWRVSTLGSICEESGGAIQTGPFGSQLHASDYLDEGVPVVMPQDLAERRVKIDKIARVGVADADRLARHQMRPGDIVFSRRGDVGRHALVGVREAGWLCGTGCLLVRPGHRWPSSIYLSLALDRDDSKEWLLRHAVGATMPNLNTGILSAIPIVCPDVRVLSAFDDIVRGLDEHVSHSNALICTLITLRDILLPRLLTGQLRQPEFVLQSEATAK